MMIIIIIIIIVEDVCMGCISSIYAHKLETSLMQLFMQTKDIYF